VGAITQLVKDAGGLGIVAALAYLAECLAPRLALAPLTGLALVVPFPAARPNKPLAAVVVGDVLACHADGGVADRQRGRGQRALHALAALPADRAVLPLLGH